MRVTHSLRELRARRRHWNWGDWGGNLGLRPTPLQPLCPLGSLWGPGYTQPGPESGVMRGRAGPSCRSQSKNGNWEIRSRSSAPSGALLVPV